MLFSNGTNQFEVGENHLADNIPKTRRLAYSPIVGYSEYKNTEKQNKILPKS